MQELNLSVSYKVLHSPEQLCIMEQGDSYINIIKVNGNNPLSYAIESHSYLLNPGESCIHYLPAQHKFSCDSTSDDATTLIITLPAQGIKEAMPAGMQREAVSTSPSLRRMKQSGDVKTTKCSAKQNADYFVVPPRNDAFLEVSNEFSDNLIWSGGDSRIALLMSQLLDLHSSPTVFHRLKIQSLLIDLLAHQLQRFYDTIHLNVLPLSKTHYEKVLQAKDLITTNLSRNYTIPELAKEVGTNEQYLKKYFKQYFGKTVMGYMVECKMNHARNLILKSEHRVTDIARLVGYKHATHFSSAFKRHFGFIPNSLRYALLWSVQQWTDMLIGTEWVYCL